MDDVSEISLFNDRTKEAGKDIIGFSFSEGNKMYHKFRHLTLTAALITVGLMNQSILHADFKLVDVSYDGLTAFDQSGTPTTLVSGIGNENPTDVAFDSTGNMYVTYHHELSGATEVHEFSPTGTDLGTFVNTGSNTGPVGLAFDKSGNLYVALQNIAAIEKYSSTGQYQGTFTSSFLPTDLTFGSTGNLFVSDELQHFIEEISPSGTVLGSVSYPSVVFPIEMAFDSSGNLFFADLATANGGTGGIFKVNLTTSPWSVSEFASVGNLLGGLAIDSENNVYATLSNGAIEKFSSSGQDGGRFAYQSGFLSSGYLAFAPNPTPPAAAPEPASLTLFGIGLVGLAATCRWRRRKLASA